RRRVDDVEHALVGADLELLARLLVDVRRAQHRELLDLGRQRDRPADARTRALRRIDDLARRLCGHAVNERSEPRPDSLAVRGLARCLLVGASPPDLDPGVSRPAGGRTARPYTTCAIL